LSPWHSLREGSWRPTEAVAANLRRQFFLGLRDLGYVDGRHFKMEDRSANGQLERLGNLASVQVLDVSGCVPGDIGL
jgi:hypothetical protein